MSASENTVHLHRVLMATPAQVYKAFTDADSLCKWLPPFGYLARMHECDIRVGGSYRMSFVSFRSGHSHAFTVSFQELTPNQSLKYIDTFEDPSMPGEMPVAVTLREVSCGTELIITQSNIPPQIPSEHCYLGWQESLLQLKQLVEAKTP